MGNWVVCTTAHEAYEFDTEEDAKAFKQSTPGAFYLYEKTKTKVAVGKIYRVYSTYCTGDSYLHTVSEQLADEFCEKLNNKDGPYHKVEEIFMEVPHWDEDQDCMPVIK